MSEVHAKLYLHGCDGVAKEIRRLGLHLTPNWTDWPAVRRTIHAAFGLDDAVVVYEDPEGDRVFLGAQAEWEECLHLGPYPLARPLRLFVRRRRPSRLPRAAPQLDVVRAYTQGGGPLPDSAARLSGLVPGLLQKYLDNGLPSWLRSAVAPLTPTDGEVDFDVNVSLLGSCLNSQALQLMGQAPPDYQAALGLLQDAQKVNPEGDSIAYNLACCHCLLGQSPEALAALARAVALGFRDREHILVDPDLAALRDDPTFVALVDEIGAPVHAVPAAGPVQSDSEGEIDEGAVDEEESEVAVSEADRAQGSEACQA